MSGKFALLGAVALLAGVAGPAAAQGLALDRTQTLEQILANCDRSTGLPPGVTPAPYSGARPKIVINPNWLRRPDAKDLAAVYPAAARAAHAGGKATIGCVVGVDGKPHDCAIKEETPAGLGFGGAAIKLAEGMLFIPKRVDCEPVDGGAVTIPITFGPS